MARIRIVKRSPNPPAWDGQDARAGGTALSRGTGAWSSSALTALGQAFELLTVPPTAYWFDGTGVDGLPDGRIEVGRLRGLLLSPEVGPAARDAAWRRIVTMARGPAPEGQAWMVIAAGLALPGLKAVAGRLARGCPGERCGDGQADSDVAGPRLRRRGRRGSDLGRRRVRLPALRWPTRLVLLANGRDDAVRSAAAREPFGWVSTALTRG